jgi:hypothetical protein
VLPKAARHAITCSAETWPSSSTHSCNVVRFSPTSVIDGGEAQHIRWRQLSLIRLVFLVELGLRHYMLWAPVDLSPRGVGSWYSKLGPDSAAHSNKWHRRTRGLENCSKELSHNSRKIRAFVPSRGVEPKSTSS